MSNVKNRTGPTDANGSIKFIGRASLLQDIDKVMREVEEGNTSFYLVSGEAGIGKTSFLQKAKEMARSKGWAVLASECAIAEGGAPYQTILTALATYERSKIIVDKRSYELYTKATAGRSISHYYTAIQQFF